MGTGSTVRNMGVFLYIQSIQKEVVKSITLHTLFYSPIEFRFIGEHLLKVIVCNDQQYP